MIMALMGASIFVVHTISEVPAERINRFDKGKSIEISKSTIDSDVYINKKDLYDYWLFTDSELSFDEYIDLLLSTGKVSRYQKGFLTKDGIELPKVALNECEKSACYQRRLQFGEMPSVFWKGLIGIEDSRFLNHFGVDLKSIFRALATDIVELRLAQGGSTLTQQLVKNLFYSNEKSFRRKIKEMIVAIYIETKFSKEEILTSYFNEVFWGSFNGVRIKGLYSASLFYFGKRPNQIDPFEAAILIGLLKGPYYYNPLSQLDRLKQRSKVVFNKLVDMNLFSDSADKVWSDTDWKRWLTDLKNRSLGDRYKPLIYISREKDETGISSYEQYILVKSSISVLSTLKEKYKDEDIAIKVVMGNLKNNEFFSYYSKWERDKIKAISTERNSVGSALKPFYYTLMTYLGLKWTDEVESKEVTLKLNSGEWSPRESHKVDDEYVTVSRALQESLNRPLVRLANSYGFDKIEKLALDYIPSLQVPLAQYPSQLLGSIELSTYELFEVYKRILKRECDEVVSGKKSWEDTMLYILGDPSKTTIKRIVSKNLRDLNFFGKTGTSNNGYDNWFVFYDGWNLGVIWTGIDSNRSGDGLRLYGSTTSFKVFQQFLLTRGRRMGELNCEKSGDLIR
ncbi:transglycosylase domain-containing protein [Halobacteriovorax sp.]|uniref:transglycosylase domain-containing protein n=1 Tax=Halobacteriovorax sp. TaxID=2020862 RepID=UPI003562CCC9